METEKEGAEKQKKPRKPAPSPLLRREQGGETLPAPAEENSSFSLPGARGPENAMNIWPEQQDLPGLASGSCVKYTR